MTLTSRRLFLLASAAGLTVSIPGAVLGRRAGAERGAELPESVAGVPLPHTPLALQALALAQALCPEFLVNHCLRTFVFGALLAQHRGITFDAEMIFVAATLHDLGLVDTYATTGHPFEMDGADAAQRFLRTQGVSTARAALVWNSIALHTSALVEHFGAQTAIVSNGAGADVFGGGLEQLPRARVTQVVETFPRRGFNQNFRDLLVHRCERQPLSQRGTWLESFCRAHVPDAPWPDLDQRLAAGWPHD
jgi:HD domain